MAVTWTSTIKNFFDWYDIEHMKLVTGGDIDLSSYDSVKSNVDRIWGRVSDGSMPPGGGWRQSKRNTFKAWMDAGMPEATWNSTIKRLFDQLDVEHMKQVTGNNLKLDDYNSVKLAAGEIWQQVSQGFMPPGGAWPQEKRNTFKAWMDAGMPLAITWNNTIKGQFRPIDISHMKQVTGDEIDLGDYTSTKDNADSVFERVSERTMPPGNPWSDEMIQNFKAWMDAGFPEN